MKEIFNFLKIWSLAVNVLCTVTTCSPSQPHAVIVFDEVASSICDETLLTRGGAIQFTDANSTFTVVGVFLSDNNANVLCGSLVVNDVSLLYDTGSYHANPTVTSLFQRDSQHPNAIALQNKVTSFFIGKWYSVQRLLDGTSNAWTFNNHCVYHKGNTGVSGFVRLGGGFTILHDASSVFDTFITANGGIDLRETGTLVLAGALGLGSSVTMSSGGNIDGQGNKLVLGGNLTFPANKIFHIMSDTVINGLGNTLTVGDYGQLLIDNNMTLTLQNMTLVSGAKTAVLPPIRCAGASSNLVLDNVTVAPGADFPFYQGQLFIYDTVHFTGTSALVYSSPQSSFIMPSSSLYFDAGTTFSFAPSTASKNQIVMSNATSSLVLNGCTLKCTDTGLQLTKGTLTYQGSVTLDSKNGLYLSSITTVTSGIYSSAGSYATWSMSSVWSPDKHFFAVAGYGGSAARVYSFNGSAPSQVGNATYSPICSYCCAWSPDGRYLAVTGYAAGGSNQIYIYSFNGSTLTLVTSTYFYVNNAEEWAGTASWSPDGKYLAVGGYVNTTYTLQLYTFNGVSLKSLVSYENGLGQVVTLAWHPSGKYLAVGGYNPSNVGMTYILSFNGASLTLVTSRQYAVSGYVFSLCWSPDGNYIASGGGTPNYVDGNILAGDNIRIYSFNGSALAPVMGRYYGGVVYRIAWHPDGKTLAVVGYGPANGGTNNPFNDTNLMRFYQFTGSALNGLISYAPTGPAASMMEMGSCSWDPTGAYLVFAGDNISNTEYYGILQASFVPATNQAQANSIVYGNAAIGSSANLAVSGNYSMLRGTVLNQNV